MDYTSFLTPTLGVGGLLVLAVLMLLRGDIVPRRQIDAELRQKDEAIKLYREALERSEKQHAEKDTLIAGLMDTARTTRNVLAALPEAAGMNQGGSRVPTSEED
jgi:hypothetical protein